MGFADEIKASYDPKIPTGEQIAESARRFVDHVKSILLEKARNGEGIERYIKTGFFSKKKVTVVSYDVTFTRNGLSERPMVPKYNSIFGWYCSINGETMKKWNEAVSLLMKGEGISHMGQGSVGQKVSDGEGYYDYELYYHVTYSISFS